MRRRLVSVAACLILGPLLTGCACADSPSNDELWAAAMADAVFSEDSEVMDLVCLTRDDPQVIWDEAENRVLLVTWHDYEESCEPGEPLAHEDIWATSPSEVAQMDMPSRAVPPILLTSRPSLMAMKSLFRARAASLFFVLP